MVLCTYNELKKESERGRGSVQTSAGKSNVHRKRDTERERERESERESVCVCIRGSSSTKDAHTLCECVIPTWTVFMTSIGALDCPISLPTSSLV
jgi:hypothetical protein